MIAVNCTEPQLVAALQQLDSNVRFKRGPELLNKKGDRWRFTLTVKDSRGKYGSINPVTGRHVAALCWHGHGHFFEELLKINPDAGVICSRERVVSVARDNIWTDWQRGSQMYPWYASEGCEC